MRAVKRSSRPGSERPRIKESGIIESSPYSLRMSELRLMLLRDEMEDVVELVAVSRDDRKCVSMLLEDPGAGVPVLAADAFRIAAMRGQDIRDCEDGLVKALGDKYARRNAAGALAAHYRSTGQDTKADDLLGSPDREISGGALEALEGMGDA